jgi:hypothetical protein
LHRLPRATAATVALAALLAACGGGDSPSKQRAGGSGAGQEDTRVDGRPRARGTAPAAPDTAIRVGARHVGGQTWVLTGTSGSVPELQVSVEDGRYVLYGPEAVAVKDGRFRVELKLPATDRPASLRAFVGDAAGEHQAVVPLRP